MPTIDDFSARGVGESRLVIARVVLASAIDDPLRLLRVRVGRAAVDADADGRGYGASSGAPGST
jgi:hypothetical protein